MKFLFLARFSPEFKIVSQICRENTKQNNKTIRQKVCLAEARKFLLRSTELLVGNKTASSTRKDAAPFWEVWTLILPRRWFRRTLNSFYYHLKKKPMFFKKTKNKKNPQTPLDIEGDPYIWEMRSVLHLPQKGPLNYQMEQDSLLTPIAPDRASHILTVKLLVLVCWPTEVNTHGLSTWAVLTGETEYVRRCLKNTPKAHEAVLPAEYGSEGSSPLQSSYWQKAERRCSLCGHRAFRLVHGDQSYSGAWA